MFPYYTRGQCLRLKWHHHSFTIQIAEIDIGHNIYLVVILQGPIKEHIGQFRNLDIDKVHNHTSMLLER